MSDQSQQTSGASLFQIPTGNKQTRRGGGNDFEPAAAYINLDLPSKQTESGVKRVGSIRLYASDADHMALINFMSESEDNANKVLSKLQAGFHKVVEKNGEAFDLSSM
jgi:hypothetical protein